MHFSFEVISTHLKKYLLGFIFAPRVGRNYRHEDTYPPHFCDEGYDVMVLRKIRERIEHENNDITVLQKKGTG